VKQEVVVLLIIESNYIYHVTKHSVK